MTYTEYRQYMKSWNTIFNRRNTDIPLKTEYA